MRSIRWSLIAYFLVLLAGALGAVSVFVYRTTRDTLEEKKRAELQLLEAKHNDNGENIRARLDKELLAQASQLASLAKFQFNSNQEQSLALFQLRLLTAGLCSLPPQYSLSSLAWQISEAGKNPRVAELKFKEDQIERLGANQVKEYFQITSNFAGKTRWRSRSMGDRELPVDQSVFNRTQQVIEWRSDDVDLEPGYKVRCVTLIAPVTHANFTYTGHPSGGRPDPPPRTPTEKPKAPEVRTEPPRPSGPKPKTFYIFYIQCASDTAQRDQELARLGEEFQAEQQDLEERSQASLASLRNRLVLTGLAMFAATLLGGWALVWLGLAPLRRLSDAVSRVSAKDFRLPVEEGRLPVELRPIAARMGQTLDLLKRAFAREKQAAADISHELRTPLAALLTTTEVALRKPRPAEEYRELLADCRATGQQMNVLVERLLTLARLDAGVDTLRPREVDVAALAEQCAGMVRPLAEARSLDLRVHRNGPIVLKADPDKLREVLNNLLHNAIQYNRPAGSVELTVERQNGHLRLEVRDTGIGIPPEARDCIFERFYRADPSRRTDNSNSGLGLAIVKGYVDLMGGTIAVDSTPGQGSAFCIRLPVS